MKKITVSENYLERVPLRNNSLAWSVSREGIVTLEIQNRGIFNLMAQKLFKKPPVSYIHLDAHGSYVWRITDGESDITALGVRVKQHFGEDAEPLYERLAQFFKVLSSYGFISFKQ